MDHATSAKILPTLLVWAIERSATTNAEIAKAAGTKEETVELWLAGTKEPTFRQARAVAARTRVPFGFLFLAAPPPETLPIPDFRTLEGRPVGRVSLDLRDVLFAVLRKQDWLSGDRRDQGLAQVDLVGKYAQEASRQVAAAGIRAALDLPPSEDRPTRSDEFLRDLIARVEQLGVNVLRSGIVGNNTRRKLSLEEFRGFCVSDPYAPFIFINSVDAQPAQAFTLIHELVHVARGDSGISGAIEQEGSADETFCNQVAAEVLVPAAEFAEIWQPSKSVDDNVQAATRHFRLSRYVIAIRAFESRFISRQVLNDLLDRFRADLPPRSASGGGDFYRTLVSRNGRSLSSGIVDALSRDRILVRDAASLMDAKPAQLARLTQELGVGG